VADAMIHGRGGFECTHLLIVFYQSMIRYSKLTSRLPMESTVWIGLLVHCSTIIHLLHVRCCLIKQYYYIPSTI